MNKQNFVLEVAIALKELGYRKMDFIGISQWTDMFYALMCRVHNGISMTIM